MPVHVGWIFSLIRSGSSIAAYAAAAPWSLPVADEVFGPWVRTGKLYQFPLEQKQLVEAFKAAGHQLTPDVVAIANQLFELLGEQSRTKGGGGGGRVVSKCPHLMFTPEQFAAAFPHHRAVYLIRNPIHRLNSHYLKGWEWMIEKDHDVRVYTEFARRFGWPIVITEAGMEGAAQSVTFDDLKDARHSREWFREVYRGFGWEADDAALDRAEGYRAAKYHSSSKEIANDKNPDLVDSERDSRVPEAAIRAYLNDPFLGPFMHDQGWPTKASAYQPGLITRVMARFSRHTPGSQGIKA